MRSNERIAAFDAEFVRMARDDEAGTPSDDDPGDRDDQTQPRSRRPSARPGLRTWTRPGGLVWLIPRQLTTGGKPRLLGISKRGNRYLHKILIHGARAALPHLSSATRRLVDGPGD